MPSPFADRRRLRLLQAGWLIVGTMLVLLVRGGFPVPWTEAALFGLPLGLVTAPMSLSAWYLSRALPFSRVPFSRLAVACAAAALTMGALWAGAAVWWWQALGQMGFPDVGVPSSAIFALVMALG